LQNNYSLLCNRRFIFWAASFFVNACKLYLAPNGIFTLQLDIPKYKTLMLALHTMKQSFPERRAP